MTTVTTSAPVVWWRQARPVVEVPRQHIIGWCDLAGRRHGRLVITSPHFRLDRRQIETALAADLAANHHYTGAPPLAPAHTIDDQLAIEAQLRVAGYRIVERDLTTSYGLDVVGGLIAVLLGQGIDATIVVDQALSSPVRTATLHAAADALDHFGHAAPTELYESGWQRGAEDRWQLLLLQH